MQTGLAVRKLSFVNDQTCLKLPVDYFGDDLIEGNDFRDGIWCVQLQRKVCSGHRSRNSDLDLMEVFGRQASRRNHHRTVTLAYTAAAGHQRIVVLNIRIRVKRNGGNVVEALQRLAIERLDVAKGMSELHARHAHLVGGHAIKHECVIGVRAVRHLDLASFALRTAHLGRTTHRSDSIKHSGLQELPKRLAAQNVVCIRRATAAASITFITSAKMNGANPNATARCQLPVTTASHEIPAANRTNSATAPPLKFRTNDRLPR